MHASRWEELSLELTGALSPLLASIKDRLPLLRRLWIQWSGAQSQSAVDSLDFFEKAPSLIDAGIHNEHRYFPVHLPVHQLTRYELDAPWDMHQGIMKLASNLIEARIIVQFDFEPWPALAETIELPCLRRLFVSNLEILEYLRFPVLEKFAGDVHASDLLKLVEPALALSQCPLHHLCLNGHFDARTTVEVLQKFPSITDLAILINTPAAARELKPFLSSCTVSEVLATPIAPQLRCMVFGFSDSTYIDFEPYLWMMRSRWNADNCTLNGAALLIASGPNPNAAILDALREEGLDLVVRDGEDASDSMLTCTMIFETQWN
ncbi:hypothetical protein B0H19DRAFT_1377617 [Mycena capillaripes]|nr:hypothetical protein B0H19DRAFT_1377617 [Mycena capillaripes]